MHLVFICTLLLSLSFGEALKCNMCTNPEGTSCVPFTQTCPSYMTVCGSVLFYEIQAITRGCMSFSICQNYMHMRGVAAICCSSDLCN